jgi:hypothetical protein
MHGCCGTFAFEEVMRMPEEKKEKDEKTKIEIIIEGIGRFRAQARGSIAQKTIVIVALIFGSVAVLIRAPKYRNDILHFLGFSVIVAILYISTLIHLQRISQK